MKRHAHVLAAVSLVSLLLANADAAAATAQRTFVASSGNDANPCTLALPCRGFAAAVAQTSAAGEVIVLDSAGYGAVAITQSVSIIAPSGVYAGISVPPTGSATGVLIATAGVEVVLRGLTINSTGGTYGVRMTSGAKLTLEDCVISRFATDGTAKAVSIETPAFVSITGASLRDNDKGILAGYGAIVNIANSQVLRSGHEGIQLYDGPSFTSTGIYISDVIVTGNGAAGTTYCIDNEPTVSATGLIAATRVAVNSCVYGFSNEPLAGATGTMIVSHSIATSSGVGFFNNATGTFESLGDNQVSRNGTDSMGAITVTGAH